MVDIILSITFMHQCIIIMATYSTLGTCEQCTLTVQQLCLCVNVDDIMD